MSIKSRFRVEILSIIEKQNSCIYTKLFHRDLSRINDTNFFTTFHQCCIRVLSIFVAITVIWLCIFIYFSAESDKFQNLSSLSRICMLLEDCTNSKIPFSIFNRNMCNINKPWITDLLEMVSGPYVRAFTVSHLMSIKMPNELFFSPASHTYQHVNSLKWSVQTFYT